MTTLREAAQAVLDQWEGWEPMPGECEELALAFDRLAEALATPEPDGKDAALLDKLENGCQNEVVVAGLSAAQRIRALLAERDRWMARADEAEAECARLRDKYASGTFCPGCDHQRLARYEAEAARDREQARADALLAERDRLQDDLARAQREG